MRIFQKTAAVLLALSIVFIPSFRMERGVHAAAKPYIKKAIPATVLIVSYYRGTMRRKGIGTGFIIHPKGYLVTNFHNIGSTRSGRRMYDIYAYFVSPNNLFGPPRARAYRIRVLRTNYKFDLVLGKIDAFQSGRRFVKLKSSVRFPYLKLTDSSKVEPTDGIYALGFPGLAAKINKNIFTGITIVDGKVVNLNTIKKWILTNAEINPGNSGGPAIDTRGRVIGVNTAVIPDRRTGGRLSMIRPINLVRHLAKPYPEVYRLFPAGDRYTADNRRPDSTFTGRDNNRNNNTGRPNNRNDNRGTGPPDGGDGEGEDGDGDSGGRSGGRRDPDGPQDNNIRGGRSKAFSISGYVLSADTREPVSGVLLALVSSSSSRPLMKRRVLSSARSGSSGRFYFNRRLSSGRYVLVAAHPDYRRLVSTISVYRDRRFRVVLAGE